MAAAAVRLERGVRRVAAAKTPLDRPPWMCLGAAALKARRGGRTAVGARARGRAPSRVKLRGRVSIAARGTRGGDGGLDRGSLGVFCGVVVRGFLGWACVRLCEVRVWGVCVTEEMMGRGWRRGRWVPRACFGGWLGLGVGRGLFLGESGSGFLAWSFGLRGVVVVGGHSWACMVGGRGDVRGQRIA